MAHELDMTTGRAAFAYATGVRPWHGLGQMINPAADIDEWRKAAGLEWDVKRSPVQFNLQGEDDGELRSFSDRHVLYRSDTLAPLSVVSSDYKVLQVSEVFDFFAALADAGQFSIETVGALKGGRRIWALAKVGPTAKIKDDPVAPYLMLATSYDATMCTIAQFTSVCVVCNNTLQAALCNDAGERRVTVNHAATFKPAEVRMRLGIATNSWEEFMIASNAMANVPINDGEMDAYLQELLAEFIPYGQVYNADKVRASKGYQRIVSLFKGAQIGYDQRTALHGSLWGLLNATTQYVDHEKGRLQDNRVDAAWFGAGAKIKDRAYKLATEAIS